MTATLNRTLASLCIAAALGASATALAGPIVQRADIGTLSQQDPGSPADCKKDSSDPRCKDKY